MENLFDYIANSDDVSLVKAFATYFFIYQVKPFEFFSEEIGVLLFKSILGHNDFDEVSALLDFEQILSDNEEQVAKIIHEVKKTNDLTYLLVYCLDLSESIATELLDLLQNVSVKTIRNEYYDPNPSTSGVAVATRPTTVADLNGPVSEEAASQIEFEVSVALPTLPIGLEERDAVKIEEHLVEIYPTLKRGQAYFYARHCTIGKYYTIAQYKRLLGCAYETARTSMDNLVELGFYRKEKLNNKFIYTPVARR
jgi:Fic family protein